MFSLLSYQGFPENLTFRDMFAMHTSRGISSVDFTSSAFLNTKCIMQHMVLGTQCIKLFLIDPDIHIRLELRLLTA